MEKPTLVIMAAGMGSRFGGPKQIAPVDAQGHIIMDYSIYDAVRAGFGRVVCILKPEMERDFHETIGARVAPHVDLAYAYQTIDTMLPAGFAVPEGRTKPWGTAHAVLCARDQIHTPFAVINADDFYGRTAFEAIHAFLAQPRTGAEHAMVGYQIENTLSERGSVARGVCEVDDQQNLTAVVERTHIEPRPGGAAYTEDGEHFTPIPAGTTVSMNFWGYQPSFLDEIARRFPPFLERAARENPLKAEFYLPAVSDALIHEGKGTGRVLPTRERWYGITYREDMPTVQAAIAAMQQAGVYPIHLWRT